MLPSLFETCNSSYLRTYHIYVGCALTQLLSADESNILRSILEALFPLSCARAKQLVGKPFDWILVKTKESQCSVNLLVDVAIELEPVNAVNRFHRKTERE